MVSAIKDFLSHNGLWSELVQGDSEFVRSICRILPENGDFLKLAFALEVVVKRHSSNRMLLAKLCALLKQVTGKGPTEIAVCLFAAAPDLGRSVSEISKLVKAGEMWLKWPMLSDIENPDKLATLKRVPNELKTQIFESGEFPEGTPIRGLTCAELRVAVNALRLGQQPRQPAESPLREARQGLIKLANAMGGLSELMRGIPELQILTEKLYQWQCDILRAMPAIQSEPKPTVFVSQVSSGNRAVESQIVNL